jgi:hypothetical protein
MAGKIARSRLTPAVIAGSVVNDLSAGNIERAAKTAAGSTAAAYVAPRVASAVAQATAPQTAATRDALGRFTAIGKAAGPVARAASAVSQAAAPIGLAVDAIFGEGARGHGRTLFNGGAEVTPESTVQRQSTFAHEFVRQVNAEAGRTVIDVAGKSVPEIIEAIARYRAGR